MHTLWRGDFLLGRAMLTPTPSGRGLQGAFFPERAYDAVRPIMRRANEAGAALGASLRELPSGTTGEEIRAHLLAHPGATEAQESRAAVQALGLILRDEVGVVVPCDSVAVGEWTLPIPDDLDPEELELMERELADSGLRISLNSPNFVLMVTPLLQARASDPALDPRS